jgi:hypothetical protein
LQRLGKTEEAIVILLNMARLLSTEELKMEGEIVRE